MIRRALWVAVGLGAGATAAVLASRWMRRQTERLAPSNVADQAAEVARDLGKLLREAIEEGRRGMRDKEAELRASIQD